MKEALRRAVATSLVPLTLWASLAQASTPTAVSFTPINAVPPNVKSTPARPLIMLNVSRDHQLFYRAYNEFSDYDKDGSPDGGYIHTVRYSGYFDTTKCYTYSTSTLRYSPSGSADASNSCSGAWHGNFLNWATMTRIDVLRKVLYGGFRSTDTAAQTVLERASLPMDAHSFAKYYKNPTAVTARQPNLSSITPFTAAQATEITICNTTFGVNGVISQTNTNPPLMRVAKGNYSLWNAHERRQCRWNEETSWTDDGSGNGNVPATTGYPASGSYPSRASQALGGGGTGVPGSGDYVVRVEVCDAAYVGSERCRGYPSGNLKPIGLLQEYGESDLAEFGLMSGSFSHNTSGGVLRKNATSFKDEVNYTTNGTLIKGANSIVKFIDNLKIYGYGYTNATYNASDNASRGDGFCDFQTIGLTDDQCASWGNPLGEMFIETLRYLAGKTPSASYGSNADAKGATMGLTVATWIDPLGDRGTTHRQTFGAPACRPINNVNFNASVVSYDRDTTGPFSDLGASNSLQSYTNQIGVGEGIAGTSRFIGQTATPTSTDYSCTAKTLANLWDAQGLCPTAPAYHGSFSLAGAAYWANTNPIRTVPGTLTGQDAQRAFHVRTYSVALAPGVPRIEINSTAGKAVIQPAYRLQKTASQVGNGTLVDFRVISQTATSGNYLVVWEDSEQGGDYDSDVTGLLSWQLTGTTLKVTTQTLLAASVNPQGFGYTISGTNLDGQHFHSGIYTFNFTDPTNVPVTQTNGSAHANVNASGGCRNCEVNQVPSQATYTINGNTGGVLQDPMWYASKWGGFRDTNNVATGTPNSTTLWDSENNSTGAAGSDGVPDTYFEVFNPDQLETSLRRVFDSAVNASNAAPAVSSAQLVTGSFKYIASFDQTRKTGNVEAFAINSNGDFNTTASWNVGTQLTSATSRQIISNDQTAGFAFNWSNISSSARSAYKTLLKQAITGVPSINVAAIDDTQAQRIVSFTRGDRSVEGQNGIRNRDATNILGPIVNASPWLQDRPSARFVDTENPGYSSFATTYRNRTKVLWVAADDGMLHAFNGATGAPIMSYVPETLVPRLKGYAAGSTDILAYVDGSPITADVDVNAGVVGATGNAWRTYVLGTLGRGGNGVFALDGTSVSALAAAETNAASIFQWQFTANDDADVGHIMSDFSVEPATGQPSSVVKLADGRFAYVFGNGYGSSSGKAVLFILPIQGPNASGNWSGRYYKVVLDNGTGNGLSTPVLVDTDNDGRADTVYAGDRKGNLWKVDLSSTTPSNWKSAYLSGTTPVPLYIATASDGTTRLPITGAPQFSFPKMGGIMVNFATGQSVLSTDFPNTSVEQRVYGIWDRAAFGAGTRTLPRGTSTLASRTLVRTASGEVGVTSANAIDFTTMDGWYFDLPGSSEMVLSNIEYRASNILFTSVMPSSGSSCSDTPLASFYLLDPTAGYTTVATQGTVVIGGNTLNVIAAQISDQKIRVVNDASQRRLPPTTPGGTGALVCPDGSAALRIVGRTTDDSLCFQQSTARFQWREIPGLRTR